MCSHCLNLCHQLKHAYAGCRGRGRGVKDLVRKAQEYERQLNVREAIKCYEVLHLARQPHIITCQSAGTPSLTQTIQKTP